VSLCLTGTNLHIHLKTEDRGQTCLLNVHILCHIIEDHNTNLHECEKLRSYSYAQFLQFERTFGRCRVTGPLEIDVLAVINNFNLTLHAGPSPYIVRAVGEIKLFTNHNVSCARWNNRKRKTIYSFFEPLMDCFGIVACALMFNGTEYVRVHFVVNRYNQISQLLQI
jgi:hypothetical protein